jgi:hypothetical protein
MIYVGTTRDNGSAIYFDIHSAERSWRGVRISGTIGDGCYEGEALVELGRSESVTFADAWLGGDGFSEFVDRCDLLILESDLLDTVREMPIFHSSRMQPHGPHRVLRNSVIGEDLPLWKQSS